MQDGRAWLHANLDNLRDINEPLGSRRADQLAHLLGMDAGMILTPARYAAALIGIPPRDHDREIIFRCIYNLTNSTGNAAIPLSSYGLNVTEQGVIRSVCAPDAPCLEFNALLGGPLEAIAAECGFLDKFLRVLAVTPLLQFIEDAISLPGEWRTRMPHRNHLRGKRTLRNRLRRVRTNRRDEFFASCYFAGSCSPAIILTTHHLFGRSSITKNRSCNGIAVG